MERKIEARYLELTGSDREYVQDNPPVSAALQHMHLCADIVAGRASWDQIIDWDISTRDAMSGTLIHVPYITGLQRKLQGHEQIPAIDGATIQEMLAISEGAMGLRGKAPPAIPSGSRVLMEVEGRGTWLRRVLSRRLYDKQWTKEETRPPRQNSLGVLLRVLLWDSRLWDEQVPPIPALLDEVVYLHTRSTQRTGPHLFLGKDSLNVWVRHGDTLFDYHMSQSDGSYTSRTIPRLSLESSAQHGRENEALEEMLIWGAYNNSRLHLAQTWMGWAEGIHREAIAEWGLDKAGAVIDKLEAELGYSSVEEIDYTNIAVWVYGIQENLQ